MKKSVAMKWALALESGTFKQGFGKLECGGKHCCLGVLCNLAMVEGKCDYKSPAGKKFASIFDDKTSFLPDSVMKWAGIQTHSVSGFPDENSGATLIWLNDQKKLSFKKIAEIIRKNYKTM